MDTNTILTIVALLATGGMGIVIVGKYVKSVVSAIRETNGLLAAITDALADGRLTSTEIKLILEKGSNAFTAWERVAVKPAEATLEVKK